MDFYRYPGQFFDISCNLWNSPNIDPSRQQTKSDSIFRQLVMDPLDRYCMPTDESDPVLAAWTDAPQFHATRSKDITVVDIKTTP